MDREHPTLPWDPNPSSGSVQTPAGLRPFSCLPTSPPNTGLISVSLPSWCPTPADQLPSQPPALGRRKSYSRLGLQGTEFSPSPPRVSGLGPSPSLVKILVPGDPRPPTPQRLLSPSVSVTIDPEALTRSAASSQQGAPCLARHHLFLPLIMGGSASLPANSPLQCLLNNRPLASPQTSNQNT